jgi:hypothetical protein
MWMFMPGNKVDTSQCYTGDRCLFQNVNIGPVGGSTDDGSCATGHTCYLFGWNTQHWYYVEEHIKFNSSAGVHDGVYEMWMDDCGLDGVSNGCATGGTLRTQYTNVLYSTGSQSVDSIFFETHGGSCTCDQGGEYYWDQVVASKVRVGPMGAAGPDTTPPSPPTGLHILP